MKLVVGFCLVLLVHIESFAAADPAALAWLKAMEFAKHQSDYSGIFAYDDGKQISKTKVIHIVTADGEYEKHTSLDGSKKEIVLHHGMSWWYGNHQNQQISSPKKFGRVFMLRPEQLDALHKNYQMHTTGTQIVAGLECQVLVFKPNDNIRYTQKLWVHSDSGLLLKTVTLDDKNHIVDQYAFTSVKIGGDIDRSWAPLPQQEKSFSLKPAENTLSERAFKSGWVVDTPPTGFKKIKEVKRVMTGKHAPVTHIVYSDGLSNISVFIEPNDRDDDDNENLMDRGALHLYHKVVNDHLLTVVGEVPVRTVIKVLDSIRYNGR